MKINEMTIEQIATQLLAGILSNPKVFEAFNNDTSIIKSASVTAAIEYAKELKHQLDAEDIECEILN